MKENRKDRVYIVGMLLIFILMPYKTFAGDSSGKDKIKELGVNDFRIYNTKGEYISLDMSREQVENRFGKPLKIKIQENKYNSENDEIEYVYDGLKIYSYMKENKINYIYVKSRNYYTYRGVYVGDSTVSIKEEYPVDKEFSSGSLLVQYYTDDGTLRVFNIAFEVKGPLITSIIIEVASDL